MEPINVKKLDERAILPTYGSAYSAGADLYACLDEAVVIPPGEAVLIHTGLAMEIPEGYVDSIKAIVRNKLKFCQGVLETDYFDYLFGDKQ